MEQVIVNGIVTQGPYAAMLFAVAGVLWRHMQKKEEDSKAQTQQQLADFKEEFKAREEYLVHEMKRRDDEQNEEMMKRDRESQAREDRLQAIIEKQNDIITGGLYDIKLAIERRNIIENQRQAQDSDQYNVDIVGADVFRQMAGLGGRPGHIRPGQGHE